MSNFREGLNALREISDPEKAKLILERITNKKLADYEGIDALVGALMGYYNNELEEVNSNKISKTKQITVTNFNLLIDEGNFNARITPEVLNGPITLGSGDGYNCRIEILPSQHNTVFQRVTLDTKNSYIRKIIKTDLSNNYTWEKELPTLNTKEYLGHLGTSQIQYIQSAIPKYKGQGYFDEVTGKFYKCVKDATAEIISVNAEYFVPADNLSIRSDLATLKGQGLLISFITSNELNSNEAKRYYLDVPKKYKSATVEVHQSVELRASHLMGYKSKFLVTHDLRYSDRYLTLEKVTDTAEYTRYRIKSTADIFRIIYNILIYTKI